MQLPTEIENSVCVLTAKYGRKQYWIYRIILLSVLLFIVSMPFVEIDVSCQSRGIIRSMYDNVSLTPIVNGRVLTVNLVNNSSVNKGDTLMVLDSRNIVEQINSQKSLADELTCKISDLRNLTKSSPSIDSLSTLQYKRELLEYIALQKNLKLKKKQKVREYERSRKAKQLGLVSDVEYCQMRDFVDDNISDFKVLKAQKLSNWQQTKQQLEEQLINLNGEIQRLTADLSNYVITSPISGTVVTSIQVQANSYVYAGQSLAIVSPETDLIVECYASPSDVGFLKIGQSVSLQFDAFNYNQWGMGKAVVYDIDKNITNQNGQIYFVIRCKLLSDTLTLNNGYSVRLKKGMSLNGRFLVTRRTLWQLLFDKVDDWFNPKMRTS